MLAERHPQPRATADGALPHGGHRLRGGAASGLLPSSPTQLPAPTCPAQTGACGAPPQADDGSPAAGLPPPLPTAQAATAAGGEGTVAGLSMISFLLLVSEVSGAPGPVPVAAPALPQFPSAAPTPPSPGFSPSAWSAVAVSRAPRAGARTGAAPRA